MPVDPLSPIPTANFDESTDSPALARVDLYDLIGRFNKHTCVPVSEYASLTAAVTAIGSSQRTLVINSATTTTGNTTIPATLSVRVERPGTILNNYALTVNGPFEAGDYQAFAGSGTVTGLREARSIWFPSGVIPSGAVTQNSEIMRLGGSIATGGNSPTAIARFYAGEAITEHAHYGFLDNSQVNYSGVAVQAHASFNANVTYSGTQDSDHAHSYQAYPHYGSSGTLTRLSGFWMQPDVTAGTVTELSQFKALNPLGGGAITKLYGLYIDGLTRGTTNYAVYTAGTTVSHFGGYLELGPEGNAAYLGYNSSTGHLEITPRTGYETHINSKIIRIGDDAGSLASIDNNSNGNLYINASAGYGTKFAVGDIEVLTGGKGVILTNAAGTVTKRVRLNDDGTGLIFGAP